MKFKTSANLGVGCGVVAMFIGTASAAQDPVSPFTGTALWLVGWGIAIWGCVNYARWKGYSGWLGLMGYLLLPGLIILACVPNKRKRMAESDGSEQFAETDPSLEADRRSGALYLLTLLPLAGMCLAFGGFVAFHQSSIDPAKWKAVAPPGAGFQALMPGTPRIEPSTLEAPAGTFAVHKLSVQPTGKKELFAIVSIRFPENAGSQLDAEKMLGLGRDDICGTFDAKVQTEKRMDVGGVPALELVVLPAGGAIIKARVLATQTRVYEVQAHISRSRLASADVQKFFDAFKVVPEAGAGAGRAGD